jgi:hypothetical protein
VLDIFTLGDAADVNPVIKSDIPEGLMNNPVYLSLIMRRFFRGTHNDVLGHPASEKLQSLQPLLVCVSRLKAFVASRRFGD